MGVVAILYFGFIPYTKNIDNKTFHEIYLFLGFWAQI